MRNTKIEWCDATWNPITGCRHGCKYCYAASIAQRFCGNVRENKSNFSEYGSKGSGLYVLEEPYHDETGAHRAFPFGFAPTFHKYRLGEPVKLNGRTIFIGSMCDLFGDWVPAEWRNAVFEDCMRAPQHSYLFLTKNPEKYFQLWTADELPYGPNFWYGTSVTQNADWERMRNFASGYNCFISFEPLLERIEFPEDWNWIRVHWFIIGAETGNHSGKVEPSKEWVNAVTEQADRYGIPVFMKDSLIPVVGEENMRREYPEGLRIERSTVRMRGRCMSCGKDALKMNMVTINGKKGRDGKALTIGQMCTECIKVFCEKAGFDIPEEWRTDG